MSDSKITVSAKVNASAIKTWDYYTSPMHIINWNFADSSWHCPYAENDLRVGGIYKARMEARDGSFGFDFEAVYSEITDGEQFKYGFGGREATVKFNELDNQTEVVVSFDPEDENSIEIQKGGWQAILNNFKSYIENN